MSMVKVSKEHWRALVAFVRSEERILCDNYGYIGRKKKTWEAAYQQADPDGSARFDKARKAIRSVR